MFTTIWVIPILILKIFSFATNFVKYGFCFCECYLCYKKTNSIDYISNRMHKETRDISSFRHLFKYVWPLFIFFILFAAICTFNAVFMFKFENKEANLDKLRLSNDSLSLYSNDFDGYEKYLWIAMSAVALIIPIVVTLILLTFRLNHSYKFSMDEEEIKAGLLSENLFGKLSRFGSLKGLKESFKYCCCKLYLSYQLTKLIISTSLEVFMPFVPIILKALLLIMFVVYSFYVWCLNVCGLYKFLLIWYGQIMLNIFTNLINAMHTFTNCTWFFLISTRKQSNWKSDHDDDWMRNKQATKISVFFNNVLFKNFFNYIEIAFFDMSIILIFKLGKYF